MLFLVAGINGDSIGSAPAQHGADYPTLVLSGLAIKRNHDVGTVTHGIAGAIDIVHFESTGLQGFLINIRFCAPSSVLMADPSIALTERHITAGILK